MKINVNENRLVLSTVVSILIFSLSWSVFSSEKEKITLEEARNIALKNLPGVILESELEYEKGVLLYEFEIKQKDGSVKDIEIHAYDGTVLYMGKGHGKGHAGGH